MIDAVYQPHYDHFKEYFGTTFMGFFSDEPGFLELLGTYKHKPGSDRMYQPFVWRDDLPELIAESAGISPEEAKLLVPALWENLGEKTATLRMHFMEVITKLYAENFCWQIGDWCREHGVMYIGHIIEDLNAHMRLGYGAGNFFRALDGQDMAGKKQSLLLYCFVLSPLISLGAVPHHHLALSVKELTYSSNS